MTRVILITLVTIKYEKIERIIVLSKILSKEKTSLYIEDAKLIQDSIYSKFDLVLRIMLNKRLHHALVIVCLRHSHKRSEWGDFLIFFFEKRLITDRDSYSIQSSVE
jgi:hypothetical protein